MSDLSVSETQLERLEEISAELEAVYVGEYGTVRPTDALQYLLDTYTPPETTDAGDEPADAATEAETTADAESGTEPASKSEPDRDAASPESTLQQAMSLLDAHEDRWRESSGDEPYEVDLPDGSTEAVRTKDDIKRLLFKHWR